ncbi:hypothetical protein CCR75_004405 [Bremia lactucae]|uniref:Uncharacterized protein n=1 Tax=Bremia lactucae TaxID=4779 RepID=A0A976IHG2_BRELC|nr:hypothetical protein CCR75_004405 [Bremia lactucae]
MTWGPFIPFEMGTSLRPQSEITFKKQDQEILHSKLTNASGFVSNRMQRDYVLLLKGQVNTSTGGKQRSAVTTLTLRVILSVTIVECRNFIQGAVMLQKCHTNPSTYLRCARMQSVLQNFNASVHTSKLMLPINI